MLALFALGIALRIALTVAYRPGFVGFPDSLGYVRATADGLFDNSLRTGGYALFLRLVHAVSNALTATIVLQHVLGVLTAALLYATLRRIAVPAWVAAIPAAVVLFGGIQLYLEHALLSEALFAFLVCAALFCAAQTIGGARATVWLGGAGLLLGIATVVRPAGLLVAPALALWALIGPGGAERGSSQRAR